MKTYNGRSWKDYFSKLFTPDLYTSQKKLVTCVPSHQDYKNEAEAWARKILALVLKGWKATNMGILLPPCQVFFLTFTNVYNSMVSGPKINMESLLYYNRKCLYSNSI
jgi:hypothetical protein